MNFNAAITELYHDPLGSGRGYHGIRGAHSENRCNKLI